MALERPGSNVPRASVMDAGLLTVVAPSTASGPRPICSRRYGVADAHSPEDRPDHFAFLPPAATRSVKIVIAGGFGVGKTTLVANLSDTRPLSMEEHRALPGAGIDALAPAPRKRTTSVGPDYGRRRLGGIELHLFGLQGQARFRSMWASLSRGAAGALLMVDTRDLDACHDFLSVFETDDIPYAVAVNRFADAPIYPHAEIRQALVLEASTPLIGCDPRSPASCARALTILVDYLTMLTDHPSGARP